VTSDCSSGLVYCSDNNYQFFAFFACGEFDDEMKLTLADIVSVEALPRRLDA